MHLWWLHTEAGRHQGEIAKHGLSADVKLTASKYAGATGESQGSSNTHIPAMCRLLASWVRYGGSSGWEPAGCTRGTGRLSPGGVLEPSFSFILMWLKFGRLRALMRHFDIKNQYIPALYSFDEEEELGGDNNMAF